MVIWIVVGVVVLALAGWAFFPRRRGVMDGEIERSQRTLEGRAGIYDRPGDL
ncbi:hypothetical protein ABLE68_21340 [Nocardioides sp. CN2-186]|uniref:hypothetical protein n=1 Tax=Nocardioides tweenelious TaxID=3156607 RepID=UPI0032B38088